jgi:hypothetical protein
MKTSKRRDKSITSTRADSDWSFEEEMDRLLAEPSGLALPLQEASASGSRRLDKTFDKASNKKSKNA